MPKLSLIEKEEYLERAKTAATVRGGKCLSTRYENARKPLKWQCAQFHSVWLACYDSVVGKRKSWCPSCKAQKSGCTQRLEIKDMHSIAKSRNLVFLSNEYKNSATKYLWGCSLGHEWSSVYGVVKNGGNCPKCNCSIGEAACRQAFEHLFQKPFPEMGAAGLESEKGGRLLFDGYNEQLGIAFEHQGPHHTDSVTPYYGKKIRLDEKEVWQKNDCYKRTWCRRNRVILIEIPQVGREIKISELIHWIARACLQRGIEISDVEHRCQSFIFKPIPAVEAALLRVEFKTGNRGQIRRKEFSGDLDQIPCRCICGHQWSGRYSNLMAGKWCPECKRRKSGSTQKLSLEVVVEKAEALGWICKDSVYINARTIMSWNCREKGHGRQIPWDGLRSSPKCRECL